MEYHTFFILASEYWLPDYMKDYEIQLRWYCKLACITEKKTLFGVLLWLSAKQAYNEIIWCRNLAVWQDLRSWEHFWRKGQILSPSEVSSITVIEINSISC